MAFPCLRRLGGEHIRSGMGFIAQSTERFFTLFAARVGLTPDMELCSVSVELARMKQSTPGPAPDPANFFEEKV